MWGSLFQVLIPIAGYVIKRLGANEENLKAFLQAAQMAQANRLSVALLSDQEAEARERLRQRITQEAHGTPPPSLL